MSEQAEKLPSNILRMRDDHQPLPFEEAGGKERIYLMRKLAQCCKNFGLNVYQK